MTRRGAIEEREVLTEIIELYCDLPCLWDIGTEIYKDRNQKSEAWILITEKLKLLEPDANVNQAKKKIENMRSAYKREERKIKKSKRTGSGASDVHVPNLWYFNLLRPIFDRKDEQCWSDVDTLTSDEESQPSKQVPAIKGGEAKKILKSIETTQELIQEEDKKTKSFGVYVRKQLEQVASLTSDEESQPSKRVPARKKGKAKKKPKWIETAQEQPQREDKKPNSFGVYVGEQLEQVATFQRQVAEKLISEIIFLAKTGNLNFDTRIESPPMTRALFSSSSSSSDPLSPSPKIIRPSHSSQYILQSPSPQSQHIQPSSSPQTQYIQPSALSQSMQPFAPIQSNREERNLQISIQSPPLNSISNENQTSNTINEGHADSVLRELLIIKKS